MPLAALMFALGVWLAPRLAAGLWPLWLLGAAVLLFAGLWLWGGRRGLALLPVVLMLGLLYTQPFLHPATPAEGAYSAITATVYGEPMPRSGGRIALWLSEVTLDGQPQAGKAYMTLQPESGLSAEQLFDGAALVFAGTVYRPVGKQNEHDFDFRMWLLQNGTAYGISGVKHLAVRNTRETAPWTDWGTRIRGLCAARFQALMGDTGALAMAMLLGARDGLSQDEQAAFQSAGVSHLMSVSGLHVALLMGVLSALLTALSLRKSVRLPLLIGLVALYCALTGFSPAAVRATTMIVLWLLAQAAGRKPDPLATLSAAALIVLLLNPLDLFSAGFALSFAAMGGILLLYPRLVKLLARFTKKRPARRKTGVLRRTLTRLLGKPAELLCASLAAQVGVLLPVAAFFHRVPLYGVLFNLLAVPLSGLLLPLYAVTLLLSLVPLVGGLLGGALGFVAARGSELLLWLVGLSRQLPFAQVRVPSPAVWAYAVLTVAAVTVGGYVRASMLRRLAAVGLAAAIAAAGAWVTKPAGLRYHQLAVGQGDAALVMDGPLTAAIDVGEYGGEAAGRLLAENRDVDALLLTHLHTDHAAGVAQLFAEGVAIRHAYLPLSAAQTQAGDEGYDTLLLLWQNGVPVTYLAAGDTVPLRAARITVLWPDADGLRAGRSVNDGSMATLIRLGALRILSMGDLSGLYERYAATACDVLKVGHHGSATGTHDAFLQATKPDYAIVTCRDGAALPASDTLARLTAHGAAMLRTDDTGEIMIEALAKGFRITTYKAGWNHGP
jgi:competence protein ComEC